MAKIIYFGTNGCSGHYPIGIDMTLTEEESRKWCECDNKYWIENIRKKPRSPPGSTSRRNLHQLRCAFLCR